MYFETIRRARSDKRDRNLFEHICCCCHLDVKLGKQCDQIWRNFATLAINQTPLAISRGFFGTWQTFESTLGNIYAIWQTFIVVNSRI